ncbi:GTPase-associated system all-helical protein GASH [Paraburkholderia bannensis]|uniref:GTPase-associated system all-helical protein GASH n=1 Tax=Paraburkholderia bannensis TaxID=765414 RepID=UPI002AC320CA|nr:GTPase-associated system all-helical protein GASH [Paraburkholderia bannensis]
MPGKEKITWPTFHSSMHKFKPRRKLADSSTDSQRGDDVCSDEVDASQIRNLWASRRICIGTFVEANWNNLLRETGIADFFIPDRNASSIFQSCASDLTSVMSYQEDLLQRHLRITRTPPTFNDVLAFGKAIDTLVGKWRMLKEQSAIIDKASEIAIAISGDGVPPAQLEVEVEAAIRSQRPTFRAEDHTLEIGVSAAVAAILLLEKRGTAASFENLPLFALHLRSALTALPPLENSERESLRSAVVVATHSLESPGII